MFCRDGDEAQKNDLMAKVTGDIRFFVGRRVAPNYLQRMSGITHLYKKCGKASGRQWCDTA